MRELLLAAARWPWLKRAIVALPLTRDLVRRFVAGETIDDVIAACHALADDGLWATVDHLGEDTLDVERATATTQAYLDLLDRLDAEGLTGRVEVSLKLSALGQYLPGGEPIALANASAICAKAAAVGTTVTIDMEDHTTVDATLALTDRLRETYPDTGSVLQSSLHRTLDDANRLSGNRIRLCKGAYASPPSVAYTEPHEVDLSYVRSLRALFDGDGYPMVATHDPRLIEIALDVARRAGRAHGEWELQMLYGIRPVEQHRLAGMGQRVRIYVPYGTDWYGYFMRRLAERPANLVFFLRAMAGRR